MPPERQVTPERVLAVAGLTGLLVVGLASAVMIARVGDDDDGQPDGASGAAPERTAESTPAPEPTPRPLTRSQRRARRTAAELVRSRGFEPVRLRDYDPRRALRVLVGEQEDGARLAFFFVREAYVGNDAPQPSAELRVRDRRKRQIALDYGVYAPGDERCCPSGGPVKVRFRWTGSALTPLDPVPPPQQRSPAYRIP